MNAEKEALKIVNNTLSSIETVMKDWKAADKKTKNKFTERIERLEKWHATLMQWKKEFLAAKSDQRYKLLLQLHEIGKMT
ncbi:hypothetical protein J4450_04655 [Candidatus Micrarchaeota archaeon]|nr:hypothetical protein [Candidatus Micrarchaeota archaeon]